MKRIDKCFIVNGGLLVIVEPLEGEKTPTMKKVSAQLAVEERGLVVFLGDYAIPLPEDMFDYITENRLVTIYQLNGNRYLHTPTVSIELEKDTLIEAKAIYRYHKSRLENQLVGEERLTIPST